MTHPPKLEVTIEIPRGSFLKRGSTAHIDFISPLPCPFNYGSVAAYVGLEGDLLDAVVLGPRLSRGTRVSVHAFGAIGFTDRGMYDDKLICSDHPLSPSERFFVLNFFRIYAKCKALLNFMRGENGRHACEGWCEAQAAIARAEPRKEAEWEGPFVHFKKTEEVVNPLKTTSQVLHFVIEGVSPSREACEKMAGEAP